MLKKAKQADQVKSKLHLNLAVIDEQWSFVGNKSNQRWILYAVEYPGNIILA